MSSTLICLISYIFTAIKDPGIEFPSAELEMSEPEEFAERYCILCEHAQTPGTEHCSDCDICIRGYDHHCPWTGKCIGEGNILAFNVFVSSLLSSLLLIILTTSVCFGKPPR